MKFTRIYLKAFGPFRDRVIELPNHTGKNFHVVFGPNEAGKSTTLRAVTGFLFGIPERTGDAFLHDYTALRVGATLLMPNGSRLSAMRRKARKSTLFAIDEESGAETTDRPLPEGAISGLLGGLDQALYQTLFGLDLNGLVTGSDELLRGEGDVGRSLFQAAAGLASLRTLMAGLENEAAGAFKPRGSTGRLNRALNEFDEQKRALKDATIRSYAWENIEREYRQAEAKHAQLREALKNRRTEHQRLERVRANLPLVAERVAKHAELATLSIVPLLALDAAQRRVTAQERLRGAEETGAAAETLLQQLKVELEGLIVRSSVLERASAIEQAFHGLGAYRSAHDTLPRLTAERGAQTDRIIHLLLEIEPAYAVDQAAALLPQETLVARVQSLVEDHARLTERDEQLDAQVRAKEATIERLGERVTSLPEPAPVDELEASLAGVANVADLDSRQRKLARDIVELEAKLQRDTTALWGGSVSDLIGLAVPLPETATAFEGEFASLAQDEHLVEERVAALIRDLEERRRELKVLAATGEVVTQTEVVMARGERDERWSQMRRTYIERTMEAAERPTGHQTLQSVARTFEEAIKEADRLADLLHADTQRATNLETTRQRITDMQSEMQRNEGQREILAGRRQELQRRWDALIAPLRRSELPPAALREWLSRRQRLVDKQGDLESVCHERDAVAADLSQARAALDRALVACGLVGCTVEEPVAGALARANQAINAARSAREERTSVTALIQAGKVELRDLQNQRQQAAVTLTEWGQNWRAAAERLRLAANALPSEAKTRLDQFSRLATALSERVKLDKEASSHTAALNAFKASVTEIGQAVGQSPDAHDPDALAGRLYADLRETRTTETKRQQVANDIDRETRTLAQAKTAAQQAGKQLDELVKQAGCMVADELPDIEAKATRKQTLLQRLLEIDEQLVQQNARPIDDVVREADGFSLDGLVQQIADLATQAEELELQVDASQSALFGAKQQLDAIDGSPAAAEAQQALSALSARIAKEARSYARVRLASAVLSRVVQVYREQHQGPLLQRAGEVFARITLGSVSGLTVDYEGDNQVLLGVRPDGARVSVAGMSQGTRDQMFLSLRLAAIEQHIDGRGPMPVIVDDLLVQFDDDRAVATLKVLSELSKKTQVLFFTHHRHLVELARSPDLALAILVHNL